MWSKVAYPVYIAFQLLWVVALARRQRTSSGAVRRQILWLAGAAAVSIVTLAIGLVAALVYIVDVRPRLIEVQRGPRW